MFPHFAVFTTVPQSPCSSATRSGGQSYAFRRSVVAALTFEWFQRRYRSGSIIDLIGKPNFRRHSGAQDALSARVEGPLHGVIGS